MEWVTGNTAFISLNCAFLGGVLRQGGDFVTRETVQIPQLGHRRVSSHPARIPKIIDVGMNEEESLQHGNPPPLSAPSSLSRISFQFRFLQLISETGSECSFITPHCSLAHNGSALPQQAKSSGIS